MTQTKIKMKARALLSSHTHRLELNKWYDVEEVGITSVKVNITHWGGCWYPKKWFEIQSPNLNSDE